MTKVNNTNAHTDIVVWFSSYILLTVVRIISVSDQLQFTDVSTLQLGGEDFTWTVFAFSAFCQNTNPEGLFNRVYFNDPIFKHNQVVLVYRLLNLIMV